MARGPNPAAASFGTTNKLKMALCFEMVKKKNKTLATCEPRMKFKFQCPPIALSKRSMPVFMWSGAALCYYSGLSGGDRDQWLPKPKIFHVWLFRTMFAAPGLENIKY